MSLTKLSNCQGLSGLGSLLQNIKLAQETKKMFGLPLSRMSAFERKQHLDGMCELHEASSGAEYGLEKSLIVKEVSERWTAFWSSLDKIMQEVEQEYEHAVRNGIANVTSEDEERLVSAVSVRKVIVLSRFEDVRRLFDDKMSESVYLEQVDLDAKDIDGIMKDVKKELDSLPAGAVDTVTGKSKSVVVEEYFKALKKASLDVRGLVDRFGGVSSKIESVVGSLKSKVASLQAVLKRYSPDPMDVARSISLIDDERRAHEMWDDVMSNMYINKNRRG
ncbi:hypothetical protein [Candidatus Sneabacter namystus]|uniref:Uncharacterized protein n=1 Tax=Candidatus Sneabacter namystus TaxID=2601646 RepID=A0A5C0UJX9_9RICK|nr:hypothetical protein [Candidatus Sneabacter namystus]QEK39853.1 hypothetical protein FZC37_02895 [Candidatus Sneabacter namystus]